MISGMVQQQNTQVIPSGFHIQQALPAEIQRPAYV